jgi:Protein of unknown function (DUF3617)
MKQQSFVLLLSYFLVSQAEAAFSMKAGLWEHKFDIKSKDGQAEKALGQMQKHLAEMPPEQRKKIEDMMASKGIQMGSNASTVKICLSKEQAQDFKIPQSQNDDCKQEVIHKSDKSIKMKFVCLDKNSKPQTTGEAEITLKDSTHYVGAGVINTTRMDKKETMTINQSGKWLSADCGDIKPIVYK